MGNAQKTCPALRYASSPPQISPSGTARECAILRHTLENLLIGLLTAHSCDQAHPTPIKVCCSHQISSSRTPAIRRILRLSKYVSRIRSPHRALLRSGAWDAGNRRSDRPQSPCTAPQRGVSRRPGRRVHLPLVFAQRTMLHSERRNVASAGSGARHGRRARRVGPRGELHGFQGFRHLSKYSCPSIMEASVKTRVGTCPAARRPAWRCRPVHAS